MCNREYGPFILILVSRVFFSAAKLEPGVSVLRGSKAPVLQAVTLWNNCGPKALEKVFNFPIPAGVHPPFSKVLQVLALY